ncbi:hydroxysqualene dehydroxylase HpnE [Massilia sp. BSC265]|uniref:hydroxysqualene dehydroxylase HpnE n=1 Tax=Massilia sp. BSC265 TaxID=1549812 RepID=UPI0004E87365|nr:hydroxysqualene dehydroxylase HpnE [Massilia sp. BSC265]KFI07709.1 phytoene dehydrogenase [Massilia sp. BSC265]
MSAPEGGLRVAVAGGGWAGCAAAVELAAGGARVTLIEAARSLGGRARGVAVQGKMLDNGQHILLGAYGETLRLLRLVGIDPGRALLRLPVQMRYPEGREGMDFVAPRWPAPLHLAAALVRAKGLAREDKMALARFTTAARWMGWVLYNDCTVDELLERFDQPARLKRLLWHPLCIAALNTPPQRASAKVFLAVLRDSLGAKRRAASDMLLPRMDMGALFPQAAARFVEGHGGKVLSGVKLTAASPTATGWRLALSGGAEEFDALVLATPATQSATILAPHAPELAAQLSALAYEPIATCYLQYDPSVRLALPFYALLDDPAHGRWGQFAFDRGQLDAGQQGLLAVVISAAAAAAGHDQEDLAGLIAAQLARDLRRPELAAPQWSRVITEKRATFSCTPDLVRPGNETALPGLVLAGDYTASDYPATLETAVQSGVAAAALIRSYDKLPPEKRRLSHTGSAPARPSVS